ncbi:spore coat protein GerQ [Halalkalibacterium halodurans]|nr:spore coat protein GerQ [Halalkalibacterium halodurans]MED4164455.1 spore coat protein GerQ [Halalkalibacterium halodurans]
MSQDNNQTGQEPVEEYGTNEVSTSTFPSSIPHQYSFAPNQGYRHNLQPQTGYGQFGSQQTHPGMHGQQTPQGQQPGYFSAQQYQFQPPGFTQQQVPQQQQPMMQPMAMPDSLPLEQSYIENILRLNRGKQVTVYMTFENNLQWNAMVFNGRVEEAGRDHIILSDPETGLNYLLLMVYLDYITFEEPIEYRPLFGLATYAPR